MSEDPGCSEAAAPLGQAQVSRLIRARLDHLLVDDSCTAVRDAAIYTLADPRDLRCVRYVGQTRSPRRRLLQHLNTARLWLPDELPWWVLKPELRPLYEWIRTLFGDGRRLPAMIVVDWTTLAEARVAERRRILDSIAAGHPLFNVEARQAGAQLLLPLEGKAALQDANRTLADSGVCASNESRSTRSASRVWRARGAPIQSAGTSSSKSRT